MFIATDVSLSYVCMFCAISVIPSFKAFVFSMLVRLFVGIVSVIPGDSVRF